MEAIFTAAISLFGDTGPQVPETVSRNFSTSTTTVDELRRLSGREKRCFLLGLGVPSANIAQFLRAIQFVTVNFVNATVPLTSSAIVRGDIVPSRSAHAFSHLATVEPILGYCETVGKLHHKPVAAPGSDRRTTGAVGIRNQGATCYLNSLLQSLFHCHEFRRNVYSIPIDSAASDTSITLALQELFANLQVSDGPCETQTLTKSFGWTSADAFYQQDVAELCTLLLDKLEEKLKSAALPNFVERLFFGKAKNYFVVPDIPYESTSEEPVHALTLVAKGCRNIYESLDMLIAPDHLTGSNKYCLERDGKKTYHDAKRGVTFTTLPEILFINMLRFEYDVVSGAQRKVMTRWEYYDDLDLTPYISSPPNETSRKYRLHSVLVHSGYDSRHGHYYSFVRVNGKWLRFNDEFVEEASAEQVFGANFGGTSVNYWGSIVTQSATAYMLVYIRDSAKLDEDCSIPEALEIRLANLKAQADQATREKSQEHLFHNVTVITPRDVEDCPTVLRRPMPRGTQLRCRRSEPLSSALQAVIEPHQSLWTYHARETGFVAVQRPVANEGTAEDIPLGRAWSQKTVFAFNVVGLTICHHKFFDSDTNELRYVTSTEASVPCAQLKAIIAGAIDEPSELLDFVVEETETTITAVGPAYVCVSGDIVVWFKSELSSVRAYYHFLRHRVRVAVYSTDFRKGWPKLCEVEIADDATYMEMQAKVAQAIGFDKPTHIRFSKHNPDTGCPHPQRLPAVSTNLVRQLLQNNVGGLSDRVYCDLCEVPAEVADQRNYIRFEVFNDSVRFVSCHGVVLPNVGEFTVGDLLDECAKAAEFTPSRDLRFVDIWKGRIYGVLQDRSQVVTENFQALADYRLEQCPERLSDVDPQQLVHVQHVSRSNHAAFSTHSDPFSMWIGETDTPVDILKRIADRLKLPHETVLQWKPVLAVKKELVEVDLAVALWEQIRTAGGGDPAKVAFCLEHTPLPGTRVHTSGRREEGIKIRN